MSGLIWSTHLPPDVKAKDYHRCDPAKLGIQPPIPFKPEEKATDVEADKASYFQVLHKGGVKQTYEKFVGGTAEGGVQHCAFLDTLYQKLGYVKDLTVSEAALEEAQADMTINSELITQKNGKKKLVHKKDCKDAFDQAKKDAADARAVIVATIDSMTTLFERSLGQKLAGEWNSILETTFDPDAKQYIAKGGIVTPGARPKDLDGYEAARSKWLQNEFKCNAAEKQRQYLSHIVVMPKRGVTVKQFINRFEQVDKSSTYLPTRKDAEGAPADMERGDKPINAQQKCEILLAAVPQGLSASYWGKMGLEHVETDVKQLTKDLSALEIQHTRMQAILDQARAKKAGTNGAKMDSMGQSIPKKRLQDKAEEKKGKNNGGGGGKRTKRLCQNCARFSPLIQHTHNTKDCRKWDAQGNSLTKRSNAGGPTKRSNAHSKDDDEEPAWKECFLQLRKDVKKLKGKSKRSKKSKRSRYDTSSDEDSDSDA